MSLGNGLASEEVPAAVVRNQQFTADELCQRCPKEKRTDTRVAPCLLIGILLSLGLARESVCSHLRNIRVPAHACLGKFRTNGQVTFTSTASSLSLTSAPEFSISTLSLCETIARSRKETMWFFRVWLARILLPLDASLVLSPVTRNLSG